jgi:hypothetical protein
MAGEWIPIDCNLGTKPEVLEVAAATHEPIEVVVGRMVRLWSWAWHVTADGTIRVPRSMLATVAGGDETFWSAVERAGWLVSTDDSITIPGWSERFGNAAKRRLLDARAKSVRRMSASCPHDERTDCGLEERRGEERRITTGCAGSHERAGKAVSVAGEAFPLVVCGFRLGGHH